MQFGKPFKTLSYKDINYMGQNKLKNLLSNLKINMIHCKSMQF